MLNKVIFGMESELLDVLKRAIMLAAFGRAYDDSEITGDHGVAATAELRYTGIDAEQDVKTVPHLFYDIVVVWNDDRS